MPSPLPSIHPKKLRTVADQCTANMAYQWINQGEHLLWTGDYHNGVQLLSALKRRIEKKRPPQSGPLNAEAFHRHRMFQSQKASLLNRLLVSIAPGYKLNLKRAPEIQAACEAAFGELANDTLISLRMLEGARSAYAWQKKGVMVPELPVPIRVRYGVFSPIRGEYLSLIKTTSLPENCQIAFDIGTGSGIIAAILAMRGIPRIIATDTNEDAIACASENFAQLNLQDQIQLEKVDLFPSHPRQADLIVCNPPWIPARPTSPVEAAVYDPDNAMLTNFLSSAACHLTPNGQIWLIMSNLAELIQLRPENYLKDQIAQHRLHIIDRIDTQPSHMKSANINDPLHDARAREVTSLWRLAPSPQVPAKL